MNTLIFIGVTLAMLSMGGLSLLFAALVFGGKRERVLAVPDEHRLLVQQQAHGLELQRVSEGVWRQAHHSTAVHLHGLGDPDPHTVYRLTVNGGWAVSLRTGQLNRDQRTGDEAFDAVVSVRLGVSQVDARVREALCMHSDARLVIQDGMLSVAVDGSDLLQQWARVQAVRDALDAAEGTDVSLVLGDPCAGVRACALARLADVDLARQRLVDPAPEVQLVAAQLIADPDALASIVSDPTASGDVRFRALAALTPAQVHALIPVLVDSSVPSLWWGLVRLETLEGLERSTVLRRLVRVGALDATAWPAHPRVAHVGARVAMALGDHPTADAEDVLLELAGAPEDRVVVAAATAIGKVGSQQGISKLRMLLEGGSRPVRMAARDAIAALEGRLGGRGAVSLAPLSAAEGALSVALDAGEVSLAADFSPQADDEGQQQQEEPEP